MEMGVTEEYLVGIGPIGERLVDLLFGKIFFADHQFLRGRRGNATDHAHQDCCKQEH